MRARRRLLAHGCGALLAVAAWAHVAAAQAPALSGVVTRDSTGTPIEGARVSLPGLDRHAVTNAAGAYRFDSLAAGTYAIVVRAVGHAPREDTVTVAPDRPAVRNFVLSPGVTVLDSVAVTAASPTYVSPTLRGFEERRRLGVGGRFVTEAQLRKADGLRLSSVVKQNVPGVQILNVGGGAALASLRGNGLRRGPCYVDIYVDGIPVVGPSRGEPVNMDQFSVMAFAGVEYYPGGASVPRQFSRSASGCGVLLLWTRER